MNLTCVRLAVVAALAPLAVGCAIHVQGPVKEVAYDFSDAGYYDKAFAPSPKYVEDAREGNAYAHAGAYVASADEPAAERGAPLLAEPAAAPIDPEMMVEPGTPSVMIDPAAGD
jgi:hypothetical protein